jgi:hypothetical protein
MYPSYNLLCYNVDLIVVLDFHRYASSRRCTCRSEEFLMEEVPGRHLHLRFIRTLTFRVILYIHEKEINEHIWNIQVFFSKYDQKRMLNFILFEFTIL